MNEAFPVVYVARHSDTAWTISGQHTGLTDLPLVPGGEINASRLGDRLKGLKFAKVFTSPLQHASRTCRKIKTYTTPQDRRLLNAAEHLWQGDVQTATFGVLVVLPAIWPVTQNE